MKVLLTNHHLEHFAGSEIFTFELAKGLQRSGHMVVVYSKYIEGFRALLSQEGITVCNDLKQLATQEFDVAHVHHHINALEVRQAFPNLPIFFLSHGAASFLENPPSLDINISQFGAISRHVKRKLISLGIKSSQILLVPNLVDDSKFAPQSSISEQPKRALILSNRIDLQTEQIIRQACQKLQIEVTAVGARFRQVSNHELPRYINQVDLVFTIGRGVLETMFCGRVPLVLDHQGGDGLVTPTNYRLLENFHFSGKRFKKRFTVTQLVREIKKYHQEDGPQLQKMVVRKNSVEAVVAKLEGYYSQTIKQHRWKKINQSLLDYIVNTVQVTRQHALGDPKQHNLKHRVVRKIKRLKSSFNQEVASLAGLFYWRPRPGSPTGH
jgi:hypothetical protein